MYKPYTGPVLSFSKETAPADTVLLHGGYARCPNIVHPSPFVFKVELFMRINKIPYKVSTITDKIPVITVRNEVAKVMFLHLSVSHSVHGGVCLSACWDTTPRDQAPPWSRPPGADTAPADSYCCGRYASHWNAFLFN